MMTVIDSFYTNGVHSPLSNFYPSVIPYITPGSGVHLDFPTVEHYYQAMKSFESADHEMICKAATAGQAKKLGRQVRLRSDWEAVKYDVMLAAIQFKFAPGTELAAYLLGTDDALLIEGNTWGDRTWGRVNGLGSNWLGTILMAWRCELRALKAS